MKKHGFVYEFKKNKALFFMVAPTVLLLSLIHISEPTRPY